jgi:hypothetical protein
VGLFGKYYDKKEAVTNKKRNSPMLMSYYKLEMEDDKEEHLCIFAFVSKQVAIRKLK